MARSRVTASATGSEMPDALEQLLPVAEAVTRLRAISGRKRPDVVT